MQRCLFDHHLVESPARAGSLKGRARLLRCTPQTLDRTPGSRDGGANWADLRSFRRIRSRWFWFSPAEKPYSAYVQAIALSPTDPSTIVVGIEAGAVVRSTDGGQSWSGHRRGALRDCHSLTFHSTNGNWVYEGGGSIGAGVSVSRGAVWQTLAGG